MHNMKKLKLTFTERFHLIQLMPPKDSFENLMARKDVMEKIELTPDDLKEHNFEQHENGRITWKDDSDKTVEIEFGNTEREYIKQKLSQASDQKNLDAALCDIYSSLK